MAKLRFTFTLHVEGENEFKRDDVFERTIEGAVTGDIPREQMFISRIESFLNELRLAYVPRDYWTDTTSIIADQFSKEKEKGFD